jgi:actin-related protein
VREHPVLPQLATVVSLVVGHSFAAGKGSALVIDVGHDTASVTPVFDGFVLRKGQSLSFSVQGKLTTP